MFNGGSVRYQRKAYVCTFKVDVAAIYGLDDINLGGTAEIFTSVLFLGQEFFVFINDLKSMKGEIE